jgi:ABC-2 type transport system permease protein
MVTAGRRRRMRSVGLALVAFAAFMHLLAYSIVGRFAGVHDVDAGILVVITGSLLLSWSLMVSQAMESVTRTFYARSDLDLILSSPTAAAKVHAVRIGGIALSIALMGTFLAAPFINVLVALGGVRWLGLYGMVPAMGMVATAAGIAVTMALFRTIGAGRTRLVAQIIAAVIGAAFVIGLQVAAIASGGPLSRIDFLTSAAFVAHAPEASSMLFAPARAALGGSRELIGVVLASLAVLGVAIALLAPGLGNCVLLTAGISRRPVQREGQHRGFRPRTPRRALRRKEWKLLLRDPWLISQSLMQILYLLPPAILLWRGFGDDTDALLVLVPVLVMAAGQLAGGLAWIAVSGEDAPDLVGSAPVPSAQIVRAKLEAVLGAIAIIFMPFILALIAGAPRVAAVTALGIVAASASAFAIQLWFCSPARRKNFRRRQVSSRMATFAEAFSSITWAASAALAAAGTWLFLATGVMAIAILAGARWLSPAHATRRGTPAVQFALP